MDWSCISQIASGLHERHSNTLYWLWTRFPSYSLRLCPYQKRTNWYKFCQSDQTGDISNPRYTELEANTITVTLLRRLGNNNVHSLRFGRFRAVQRIYPRFANYWSNVLIFVIHHIRDVLQNMAKLDFRIDG